MSEKAPDEDFGRTRQNEISLKFASMVDIA